MPEKSATERTVYGVPGHHLRVVSPLLRAEVLFIQNLISHRARRESVYDEDILSESAPKCDGPIKKDSVGGYDLLLNGLLFCESPARSAEQRTWTVVRTPQRNCFNKEGLLRLVANSSSRRAVQEDLQCHSS